MIGEGHELGDGILEREIRANASLQFLVYIILLCSEFGVDWSIENPRYSLLWSAEPIVRNIIPLGLFVHFDQCQYDLA